MATPTAADTAAVISAISSLGSLFVVGINAWVAYNQLTTWRHEAVLRRRTDVSEKALAVLAKVDDGLKDVRSPFDRIPAERANKKESISKENLKN